MYKMTKKAADIIQTIPATTLRYHLGDALKNISHGRRCLLVTRKNRAVSALINIDFLEDLLAMASPAYRESIREAREDYGQGRVFTHQQVFGKL